MDSIAVLVALAIGIALGLVLGLLLARGPGRRQTAEALHAAPVLDALERLRRRVDEAERLRGQEQAGLRTEIGEHLRHLEATAGDLRSETGRLAAALGRTQIRGRWGEAQLRRLVEAAGMLERVHFVEQDTTTSGEDGSGVQRPDLIVDLGAGRRLVIDAKVPLDALLAAEASDDPAVRTACQARHAVDVATHVDRLGAKEYWRQYDDSIDLVVLFLPAESMLGIALVHDPALLDRAFGRRVILATPTTLLALLRTVAHVWRQEAMADNAREIQAAGRELYDRLRKMTEHLSSVGASLGRTVDAYNQLVGSVESRTLVSARRLADLGVDDRPLDTIEPLTRTTRTPREVTDAP